MAKVFFEEIIGGETVLRNATTPSLAAAAALVKTRPGPGKPFWAWTTIPSGQVIGCDFSGAPLATSDTAQNLGLINSITASPEEVLTYAE